MAKTQKHQSKRLSLPAKILLGLSLAMSAVALLLISEFLLTYQFNSEWRAKREFGQIVRHGQMGNTSEPVIEPEQERLYFYEAEIYVPLTDEGNNLRYSYFEFSGNETEKPTADMQIISVPALYALDYSNNKPICWQLANISFDQKNKDSRFPLEATINLADGRTMYIYPNRSNECSSEAYFRQGIGPDTAVKLLRQAQSY